MSKLGSLLGGIIFLVLAAVSLYRLLFYFPIDIGGMHVGQTASFFAFVICTVLCLILLRQGLARERP